MTLCSDITFWKWPLIYKPIKRCRDLSIIAIPFVISYFLICNDIRAVNIYGLDKFCHYYNNNRIILCFSGICQWEGVWHFKWGIIQSSTAGEYFTSKKKETNITFTSPVSYIYISKMFLFVCVFFFLSIPTHLLLFQDWEQRQEEDNLLIERILLLVRNVLHVPADPCEEKVWL